MADSFEKLKAEFLAETEDTLANLQQDLRGLEAAAAGAALPEDVVDRVFRTTHSLKGVAGMFGLDAMSALAHSLENVLGGLRERRFPLDAAILDLLHRGHESLHMLLGAAGGDETAARAAALQVGDDVAAALSERARQELGGNPAAQVLARLAPDELDGVRRAASAGRTIAMVDQELPSEGFEEPFREMLAAIRCWGTVHGTVTVERDEARRSFRVRTVASGESGLFALIRELAPLGAQVSQVETTSPGVLRRDAATSRPDPSATASPPRAELASLRVPVERVDRLLFEVGELVQAKVRLDEAIARVLGSGGDRTERTLLKQQLRVLDQRIRTLRDVALGVRAVKLEPLFGRLERVFREACRMTGCDARFVAEGGGTELDKSAVEALAEPLIHLVRNAVDHGLDAATPRTEAGKDPRGTVRVSARSEGSRTVLEVSDDGAGIDFARVLAKARELGLVPTGEEPPRARLLDLVFHPGLTVKDEPTQVSGRGVGLDVVREAVTRIGGILDVDTGPSGTTFRLKVPTSLAVVPALEVEACGEAYFLPLASIIRVLDVSHAPTERVHGEEAVVVDGSVVPTRELARRGSRRGDATARGRRPAVLVGVADRRALLVVDRLGSQRDIVVRSLGDMLGSVPGIAGCAELADGRTVLVIDPASLLDRVGPWAEAAA